MVIQLSLSGAVNADCDPTVDIFCKLLGSEFSIAETSKASTPEFCDGFKAGFKAEFNRALGGNAEPIYSQCPLQPPKGKGLKSDYEYGYIFGVKQYNYESGSESGSKSYSRPPQFCEGFRDGYKSEFNRASRGSAEPFYSQCPQPFSGKEGYEDG
ncbi:MAG: hypothetical protein NZ824_01355, partial [Candidatus Thioglobus sp.]|nr:hypothetical protein [Candidatus Thioglobus sp.]